MHKLSETDYLLSCLGEECGEVQQAVGKSLRFGLYSVGPSDGMNNFEQLRNEVHDMCAMFELICIKLKYKDMFDPLLVKEKQDRIIEYMEISRKIGRLK